MCCPCSGLRAFSFGVVDLEGNAPRTAVTASRAFFIRCWLSWGVEEDMVVVALHPQELELQVWMLVGAQK